MVHAVQANCGDFRFGARKQTVVVVGSGCGARMHNRQREKGMNLAAGPPPIDQVGTVVSSLGGGHYIPIPASRPIFQSPNQGLSCVYKYTALDSELVFLCKWMEVPNLDPPNQEKQLFQELEVNPNESKEKK